MQDFLEFLHSLFFAHISKNVFITFLKPFAGLIQIFSKFHQISTHFSTLSIFQIFFEMY